MTPRLLQIAGLCCAVGLLVLLVQRSTRGGQEGALRPGGPRNESRPAGPGKQPVESEPATRRTEPAKKPGPVRQAGKGDPGRPPRIPQTATDTPENPAAMARRARGMLARWQREGLGHAAVLKLLIGAIEDGRTTPMLRAALLRALPYFAHHAPSELPAIQEVLRAALSGRHGSVVRLSALASISGAQLRNMASDPATGLNTLEAAPPRDPASLPASPFHWKFRPADLYQGAARDIQPLLLSKSQGGSVMMLEAAIDALTAMKDPGAMDRLLQLFEDPEVFDVQRGPILQYLGNFPESEQAQRWVIRVAQGGQRDEKVRAEAASVLQRFPAGSPARLVMAELAHDMKQARFVRAQAQKGLLLTHLHDGTLDQIRRRLAHADAQLRYEYAIGVKLLRNKQLDVLLAERFELERDEKVRKKLLQFKADRKRDPIDRRR